MMKTFSLITASEQILVVRTSCGSIQLIIKEIESDEGHTLYLTKGSEIDDLINMLTKIKEYNSAYPEDAT